MIYALGKNHPHGINHQTLEFFFLHNMEFGNAENNEATS
jgi:hypothetical protein